MVALELRCSSTQRGEAIRSEGLNGPICPDRRCQGSCRADRGPSEINVLAEPGVSCRIEGRARVQTATKGWRTSCRLNTNAWHSCKCGLSVAISATTQHGSRLGTTQLASAMHGTHEGGGWSARPSNRAARHHVASRWKRLLEACIVTGWGFCQPFMWRPVGGRL